MKVFIGADELYPFYYMEERDSRFAYDIDSDTVARWRKVMADFWQVQDEMAGWGR